MESKIGERKTLVVTNAKIVNKIAWTTKVKSKSNKPPLRINVFGKFIVDNNFSFK